MIEKQRLVRAADRAMDGGRVPGAVVNAVLDAMIDNLSSIGSGHSSEKGTSFMLARLRDLRDGMR